MESHSGHAVRASNEVGRERSGDAPPWPRLRFPPFPPFPPFLLSPLFHAFSGSSLRPLESACEPERKSTVLRGFSPQSQSSDDDDDDDGACTCKREECDRSEGNRSERGECTVPTIPAVPSRRPALPAAVPSVRNERARRASAGHAADGSGTSACAQLLLNRLRTAAISLAEDVPCASMDCRRPVSPHPFSGYAFRSFEKASTAAPTRPPSSSTWPRHCSTLMCQSGGSS